MAIMFRGTLCILVKIKNIKYTRTNIYILQIKNIRIIILINLTLKTKRKENAWLQIVLFIEIRGKVSGYKS